MRLLSPTVSTILRVRAWTVSRRTSRRGCENARFAAEPEKIEGVGNRPNARFSGPQVVARSEIDALDSARKAPRAKKKLEVRRPAAAAHNGRVTARFQELTKHRNSVEPISRERIRGLGLG